MGFASFSVDAMSLAARAAPNQASEPLEIVSQSLMNLPGRRNLWNQPNYIHDGGSNSSLGYPSRYVSCPYVAEAGLSTTFSSSDYHCYGPIAWSNLRAHQTASCE